ncbi:MAG TPA: DUF5320 domain-containing protein [Myxococcota bacterium]|nr:DUF5320 domain-containing protein [Myxococcota bacterium]
MPGGDRTGPMGQGPRTGRAAGYCAGYDRPGYVNGYGGGYGWGHGRGHRWGRGYDRGVVQAPYPAWGAPPWGAYAPSTKDELEMLKGEHEHLEQIMADIQKRIKDIQNKSEKK